MSIDAIFHRYPTQATAGRAENARPEMFNRLLRQADAKPAAEVEKARTQLQDVVDIRKLDGVKVAVASVDDMPADREGIVNMLTDKLKNIMGKVRDLMARAAGPDMSTADRAMLQKEFMAMRGEINQLPELARKGLGDQAVDVLKTVFSDRFLGLTKMDISTAEGAKAGAAKLDRFVSIGLYGVIRNAALTRLANAEGGHCGNTGGGCGTTDGVIVSSAKAQEIGDTTGGHCGNNGGGIIPSIDVSNVKPFKLDEALNWDKAEPVKLGKIQFATAFAVKIDK